MSILLAPSLVVAPSSALPARHPVIGWHNLVLLGNLTSDSAADGYPVTNLANPATTNRWLSASTAEQLVTVSDLQGAIDYVAVARHNFGTAAVTVSVEGKISGGSWEELFPGVLPGDDGPMVLRFASDFYTDVRLRLIPQDLAPFASVLYVGEALVMLRPMQPGFTPIGDAKSHNLVGGWSQSGEMLGSIIDGSRSANSAAFILIDVDWYRETMRPFVLAANLGESFFFAWNPEAQPNDVAYCVFSSGEVQPSLNQMSGRRIDITLPMTAVSL